MLKTNYVQQQFVQNIFPAILIIFNTIIFSSLVHAKIKSADTFEITKPPNNLENITLYDLLSPDSIRLDSVKITDDEDSIQQIQLLAEHGDAQAQFELAVFLYDQGDLEKSLLWLKKAAQQNLASAQTFVGLAYLYEIGIPQNNKKGLDWLRQAAEQSNPQAHYWMGILYEKGIAVEQNQQKSIDHLKTAATLGDVDAETHLGIKFFDGIGIAKDHKKAFKWIQQAARKQDPAAQHILALTYLYGLGVEQNTGKALEQFNHNAQQQNPDSLYFLGLLHLFGEFVPKNVSLGVFHLKKAADLGSFEAHITRLYHLICVRY